MKNSSMIHHHENDELILNMDNTTTVDEDAEKTDEPVHTDMFTVVHKLTNACKYKEIDEIDSLIKNHKLLKAIIVEPISLTELESPDVQTNLKRKLLEECYKTCDNNKLDRLFFAAAVFDLDEINRLIEQHDLDFINQTRYSDTVIVFVLKYADISHDGFLKCMEILIEAGVDINFPDFYGKMTVDHVAELYKHYKDDEGILEQLQKLAKILFEKGLCESKTPSTVKFIEDLNIGELSSYVEMSNKNKLFYWIATRNNDILNIKFDDEKFDANWNNSENTLLQLACKKNNTKVVQYLLKNGADPNMTTQSFRSTPLEIAASNRRDDLFKIILDYKSTIITKEMFNNFVKWRSNHMNLKSFKMLLESEKLDPDFQYESTGNTPLHYAIRFSHKEAVRKILKRSPTSLHVANKENQRPLDMIYCSDLGLYFDSCLVPDRYQMDFKSPEYKMLLRFESLILDDHDEVGVLSKISNNSNLEQLLTHPLIHTFIDLKWTKIQKYFWITVFLQAFLFLSLSVSLYHMRDSPLVSTVVITIILINTILKFFIIVEVFQRFFELEHKTLHWCGELLLVITILLGCLKDAFKAFAFVQMSILFLLTIGYHPRIAKWSVMLQKVFKTFTMLLLFFSLIIMAFAAAFHLLFQNSDHKFMTSFGKSVFITFVMTAGEINVDDVEYKDFGGYILFFLFVMCLSLVIVNFWTGVAVNDIDKIERKAEVNAFKNVILFMRLIDTHVNANRFLKKYFLNCLLFPPEEGQDDENNSDSSNNRRTRDRHSNIPQKREQRDNNKVRRYEVDFYLNRMKQFDRNGFPERVSKICLEKIEEHLFEQQKRNTENEIFGQLEEIKKTLDELKRQHASRDSKNETSRKKR